MPLQKQQGYKHILGGDGVESTDCEMSPGNNRCRLRPMIRVGMAVGLIGLVAAAIKVSHSNPKHGTDNAASTEMMQKFMATGPPPAAPTVAPAVAPPMTPAVDPPVATTVAPAVAVAPGTPTVAPTVAPPVAPTVAPPVAPPVAPTVAAPVAPTVAPTVAPPVAPGAPTVAPTVAPPAPTVAPITTSVACTDDPAWRDTIFGDGNSGCDFGANGGIVANPGWCAVKDSHLFKQGATYAQEARKYCPRACGICGVTTTPAPPKSTKAPEKASTEAPKDEKASKKASKDEKASKKAPKDEKASKKASKDEKASKKAPKDEKASKKAPKDEKASTKD